MSIKKNITYNVIYQLLILILPIITTPYTSRILGSNGIGIQSYTYSIASYFALFSMLGINNYGNRCIAEHQDDKKELNKYFGEIYSIQVVMTIIMFIIYMIYVLFISTEDRIILLIQSIYIISCFWDINWLFFGLEQFKITVVRNTIVKVGSVICIFLFVKDKNDIYIYSSILAVSTLISQLVLWKYIKKYIDYVRINIKQGLKHLKSILILFVPVIAVSIYKIMDKVMIGNMSRIVEVGYYENTEKIINIPLAIIVAIGTVMLPKMVYLESSGNSEQSNKYLDISLEIILFASFGAMFGLIGISENLIPIFLGKDFSECSNLVNLLSITIIFIALANVIRTQILIPRKRDSIYVISTILGAIVNLVINLLLIEKYGAIGAVFGTICAEATVTIYQVIMIRKCVDFKRYINKSIIYLIAACIMLFIIKLLGYLLEPSIITLMIQVLVGGIFYSTISFFYMVYKKNDIAIAFIKKIRNLYYM